VTTLSSMTCMEGWIRTTSNAVRCPFPMFS